jgi:pilus assembly protein Flp/PilA
MSKFLAFFQDETGASAAEYALILAIVGAGIAIAALALGNTISNAMNAASNCIAAPNATTCKA